MSTLIFTDQGTWVRRVTNRRLRCLMCSAEFLWSLETDLSDDPEWHVPSACPSCVEAGRERFGEKIS